MILKNVLILSADGLMKINVLLKIKFTIPV